MQFDIFNDSASKLLDINNNFEEVGLVVFPGGQSQYIRYILETITGIATGSDQSFEREDYQNFLDYNFIGEGICDKRVWVTQTHYPEIKPQNTEFTINKAILLVENPIITIQRCLTKKQFNKDVNGEENYVVKKCEQLKKFFDYWTQSELPVHIIQMEDLHKKPVESLIPLLQYLINQEDIKDSLIENKLLSFIRYNKNASRFQQFMENQEKHLQNNKHQNTISKILKNHMKQFNYIESIKENQEQTWVKNFNQNNFKNALIQFKLDNKQSPTKN